MSWRWGSPDETDKYYVENTETGAFLQRHELPEDIQDSAILPYWTKDRAYDHQKNNIEMRAVEVMEGTLWIEQFQQNFHIDLDFTLKAVVRDADKSYTWKTADKEADGETPVWVSLNKQELKDLYDYFTDHGEHVFQNRETHKQDVTNMYLDPGYTAEDIMNYDYTTGW